MLIFMCLLVGWKCRCSTRGCLPFHHAPSATTWIKHQNAARAHWEYRVVAFWLLQTIRKKREREENKKKEKPLNAMGGDAVKFLMLHCFFSPQGLNDSTAAAVLWKRGRKGGRKRGEIWIWVVAALFSQRDCKFNRKGGEAWNKWDLFQP